MLPKAELHVHIEGTLEPACYSMKVPRETPGGRPAGTPARGQIRAGQ